MDVHEAIATRRTAHDWEPCDVPEQVLSRALQAAQWAPCHRLTFPWRFTVVGPQTRPALTALGLRIKGAKMLLDATKEARVRAKLSNPGALLVVSQILVDDAFQRTEDYAATACAIQNLTLALHADGFHSKWSTGGLTTHPESYAILGIDPSLQAIVGFIWVGKPAEATRAPRRPPLDRVTRTLP